ncbi:MAG: heme-copper oxidase subunit III [Kineosporiaceae bacterium]
MATASAVETPHHVTVNRPNMVQVGTIVWLASELMFFAGLFAMYFTIRSVRPDLWDSEPSTLNIPFSLVNTLILVFSSVWCQLGVLQAERFRPRRTGGLFNLRQWGMREWFVVTYLSGAIFIAGQVYEYAHLVHEGATIAANSYWSVFFLTTGFHGAHVTGGLIAFLLILGRSFAAKKFGHAEATAAVVVSYYWHFVDVVWIGLFAVIYLIQ